MTEIVISPPPKKTYGQILAEKNMAQTPLFDIDALGPILTGDKLEQHNLQINFNRTNGVFSPNSA